MNIIEKLDIGILNYGRVEPDNLDGDLCMVSESDLDKFTEEHKELLEALIEYHRRDEMYLQAVNASFEMWNKITPIIEKAAGISWNEIKELNND